jgi:glucan phosphoethanolaminetransferase (alkaline phosphatase superfamily)
MLLNSIFIGIIIFSSNIYLLAGALFLFILIIYIIKKKVVFPEKRYYLTLLITAVIIQLFYNKEGEVLISAGNFVITKSGVISGVVSAIKIYGMMLISKNTDFRNLFQGKFRKQAVIFEIVLKIVPEILKMPKTMLNPGKTVKFILKKVYKELR